MSHHFDLGMMSFGPLKIRGRDVFSNLDFSLKKGSVTALLGKNGSGKTTLMECALGLIKPRRGECELFGRDSWNATPEVRTRLGYVPQIYSGYTRMTLPALINHWGAYYKTWDINYANALIDRFELPRIGKLASFSVGQRQKVSIILALAHRPDFLFLDEPVASLDPASRREFIRALVEEHIHEDSTILFSTHITSDVERFTNDVAILKNGQIAIHESLDDLKQNFVRIRLHGETCLEDSIRALPNKVSVKKSADNAVVVVSKVDHAVLSRLEGARIEHLSLEEIFLELCP